MSQRVAIVVNPSKFDDLGAVRTRVDDEVAALGWQSEWLETSPDDGGVSAAREALSSGVDVVCAFGGDGTVRAVGSVLRGTPTPLGLMPGGTGNLLARNLGLPLDDPVAAIRIALTGRDRPIDVGVLRADGSEHAFLVAAGIGFDADIMHHSDEGLKKRIGMLAYAVSGVRAFLRPGFRAAVRLDGRRIIKQRAKMILAANCAALQADVEIAPGAAPDDGQLDIVLLRPTGAVGMIAVGWHLLTGRRSSGGLIAQYPAQFAEARVGRPTNAEVDGDLIDPVTSASFGLDPQSLIVRVPA